MVNNVKSIKKSSLMDRLKYSFFYSRSMVPSLIIFLIFIIIIFGSIEPNFISLQNFRSILINMTTLGILSVGLTVVVLAKEFDLSIGSTVAFCSVIIVTFFNFGLPIPLIILLTGVIGCLVGTLNGLIITRIKVNSLITTLGTLTILKGVALLFTGEQPRIFNTDYYAIGRNMLFDFIPISIIYFTVIVIIFTLILKYTKFGRNVYAVGSNEYAAKISGINTKNIKLITFILSGFLASLVAVILTSQMGLGRPEFGEGAEIEAVTIVVLGGISILGGLGNYLGVFLALLLVTSIDNGMVLVDVPIYWRIVIRGFILIIALAIDAFKTKRRAGLK